MSENIKNAIMELKCLSATSNLSDSEQKALKTLIEFSKQSDLIIHSLNVIVTYLNGAKNASMNLLCTLEGGYENE